MLVSSRATVVSAAAVPLTFPANFTNNNRISSVSIPSSSSLVSSTIGWTNCNRMDQKNSIVTRAAASVAQPLENADALIDSVETFIFDCDGMYFTLIIE